MARQHLGILIAVALIAVLPDMPLSAASAFADPAFQVQWQADEAITPNSWGPVALAKEGGREPYKEAPGGQRLIQYFDKARMELTNRSTGTVTSGLLATELITGNVQVGDYSFNQIQPANVPVAGDPDNIGPTYASIHANAARLLAGTASAPNARTTRSLGATGTIGTFADGASDPQATIATYDTDTGHNVAAAFATFRNKVTLLNIGFAISEPFWSNVKVAGTEKDALIQVFQRRVLTYTPTNPDPFKVEFGNIGQHYYRWRYGSGTFAGAATSGYRRGVALAGAEFAADKLPGVYGTDYTYPTAAELDYYKGKGLTLIRLPFRWERVQSGLNAPLDSAELGRIDAVVVAARARNIQVILDVHNYARYYGEVIGSAAVPDAAFADFWRKIADHYKGESAIYAYGLMNEPHDTAGRWPQAAQAGVNGIRAVDRTHTILVAGDCWSGAWSWQACNATLAVTDPASNVLYEAHQYFDADSSGTYAQGYDASGAYPTVGVDRVKPFVTWLQQHHAYGFLGEYGVPGNDSRWLTVLDNFLSYLDANGIGGTYWAGGPWWEDYSLSVEVRNRKDRPQMIVLVKHLSR